METGDNYSRFLNWIDGKESFHLPVDSHPEAELLALMVRTCQRKLGGSKYSPAPSLSFDQIGELAQEILTGHVSTKNARLFLGALKGSRHNYDKVLHKLTDLTPQPVEEAEELVSEVAMSDDRIIHYLKKTVPVKKRAPFGALRGALSNFGETFIEFFVNKPIPSYAATFAVLLIAIFGTLTFTGGVNDPVYDYYFKLSEPYHRSDELFRGEGGREDVRAIPFRANLNIALGEYLAGDFDKAIILLKNLQDSMITSSRITPQSHPRLFVDVRFYSGLANLGRAESASRWTYKKYLNAALLEFQNAKKFCTEEMTSTADAISFFEGMTYYLLKDVDRARSVLKTYISDPEFGQRAIAMLERMEKD